MQLKSAELIRPNWWGSTTNGLDVAAFLHNWFYTTDYPIIHVSRDKGVAAFVQSPHREQEAEGLFVILVLP